MKRKHLSLSARIISILYIALITMFAFDTEIFTLGFIIHLLPTLIFTCCLIIAWMKPKMGGLLFMLSGIGTIITFNTYRELVPFLAISLVPIITGILFFFSKKK